MQSAEEAACCDRPERSIVDHFPPALCPSAGSVRPSFLRSHSSTAGNLASACAARAVAPAMTNDWAGALSKLRFGTGRRSACSARDPQPVLRGAARARVRRKSPPLPHPKDGSWCADDAFGIRGRRRPSECQGRRVRDGAADGRLPKCEVRGRRPAACIAAGLRQRARRAEFTPGGRPAGWSVLVGAGCGVCGVCTLSCYFVRR